jgi:hypothetical protein
VRLRLAKSAACSTGFDKMLKKRQECDIVPELPNDMEATIKVRCD